MGQPAQLSPWQLSSFCSWLSRSPVSLMPSPTLSGRLPQVPLLEVSSQVWTMGTAWCPEWDLWVPAVWPQWLLLSLPSLWSALFTQSTLSLWSAPLPSPTPSLTPSTASETLTLSPTLWVRLPREPTLPMPCRLLCPSLCLRQERGRPCPAHHLRPCPALHPQCGHRKHWPGPCCGCHTRGTHPQRQCGCVHKLCGCRGALLD